MNQISVIGNLLRWTPLAIFQTYSSPFSGSYSVKKASTACYMRVCGALRSEKLQGQKNFDELNSELEKNGNLIQTKKHQDERASEASVFYVPVSKCKQNIWEKYRPLETILSFPRWTRKRTPTASLRNRSQFDTKFYVSSNQFQNHEFSWFLHKLLLLH